MNIVRCSQGSAEWFEARCGRVTASEVAKVLSFLKKGERKGQETEARADYKASIVGEILTGEPDMEGYTTSYMNRGVNQEPLARAAYEMATDAEVDCVGFVIHPAIERSGCSPDGLVGNDGILEIKNPKTKNHIKYIKTNELPDEYEPQVMFELGCTEREWCDFMSYDSRMPPKNRAFMKRVYRDEKRIAEINAAVERFLEEVDEDIRALRQMNSDRPETLKEKLRKSVDADLGIQECDLPGWAREMRGTL